MKQAKNHGNRDFKLKKDDLDALLCALPLVYHTFGDSPADDIIAEGCVKSAGEKLLGMLQGGSASFTYAEHCTIADAIAVALDVVSGCAPEIAQKLDAERLNELHPRVFSLNRLHSYYQEIM